MSFFICILSRFPVITSLLTGLLFLLVFGSSLGVSPIVTRGEGREAQVVQAMERTSNYILPLRNESVVPSKPPLFHWLASGIANLTHGIHQTSLRLPSTLSAAILVSAALFYFSSFFSPLIGILSISIMVTCLEFLRYSTQARVDMVFSVTFSLALFSLFSYVSKRQTKRDFIVSVFFLVLSVLSKGPFGLILPGMILGSFLLVKREYLNLSLVIKLLILFVLAALISAIWYYLAYLRLGDEFLHTQLFKENMSRVVESEDEDLGHEKPFFYTFLYLLMVLVPWCLFLPRAVYGFSKYKFKELLKKSDFLMFCLMWIGILVIAVCLSVSKRSVYYLPAIAPLALFLALLFENSKNINLPRWILALEKSLLICATFVGFLVAAFSLTFALFSNLSSEKLFNLFPKLKAYSEMIQNLLTLQTSFLFLVIGFLMLILWKIYRKERFEDFIVSFSCVTIFVFLCIQFLIAPIINNQYESKAFVTEVKDIVPEENRVFQLIEEYYSTVYEMGFPAPALTLKQVKSKKNEFFLLVRGKDMPKLSVAGVQAKVLLTSDKKIANKKDKLLLVRIN